MAASRPLSNGPITIVVMGVSGSGKTSVGELLGRQLMIPFIDGDDFHPAANVEKMSAGIPLTDDDRWPWLDILGAKIGELARGKGGVIAAASSLRKVYRERMTKAAGMPVTFAHLDGSADIIAARMAKRTDHYMPLSLLDSQIATLEPPLTDENAIAVPIDGTVEEIAASILSALDLAGRKP